MSRAVVTFAVPLLALAGCSFSVIEQDPPRDIDGDGRATFNDLHAARSDAALPGNTDTRDYGQQLSDHMEHQRGGSAYEKD